MDNNKTQSALFQVYLRLRPPPSPNNLYPVLTPPERFLTVEKSQERHEGVLPTHITLNPPNDNRRRAVEKFAFTKVFEEQSSQLDLFHGTEVVPLVEGVLGSGSLEGRDGLLATLGVTGSGKSHTILGSKNQRGLTQLALDLLFRSISSNLLDVNSHPSLHGSVATSDPSEAQVMTAQGFMDTLYGESATSRAGSRAATPARVRPPNETFHASSVGLYPVLQNFQKLSSRGLKMIQSNSERESFASSDYQKPSFMTSTTSQNRMTGLCHGRRSQTDSLIKGESFSMPPPTPSRRALLRPSVLPQLPDISTTVINSDSNTEYSVVISMYEVYNDRIFDLLTPASKVAATKEYRRRPLLFKPTEQSTDRKVVAGLRKIICGNVREALMVLEAGLHERRVAGTGSNSVSSRSHGFFCVEVKKRRRGRIAEHWSTNTMTIVDLAGSERARDAKTAGATLQEAGKINESLMYLGQCLQMQSDAGNATKPNLVPFRQCKLTELLFSNSFPSASAPASSHHRVPQRAVMIVTADPVGDFNATSQILRYSALAREITVPRIPSVSATILQMQQQTMEKRSYFSGSHGTPSETERETMEIAALEIARMSEEIDGLRNELRSENEKRIIAEAHTTSFEEKMLEVEADVREECYQEMEARMALELGKWRAQWESERERGEEHIDRKIELLSRGLGMQDLDLEGEDKENERVETLEGENDRLRRQVAQLMRQMEAQRSPSKRRVLGDSRGHEVEPSNTVSLTEGLEKMKLAGGPAMMHVGVNHASPGKKIRKLTTRKWDMMGDDDMI